MAKSFASAEPSQDKKCGIIMPISSLDGCPEQHWIDVKNIINDSIKDADFIPVLVSTAEDVGVIQKTIIQNLFENPIVICDISGRNANVMFELGMRLAFDKATIIVKDDKTPYSFDTAPIEHLQYPRDLRYNLITAFKENLKEKIKATYKVSMSDPNYSTFLKHFGKFTVAKIDTEEVTKEDFIIDQISELRRIVLSQSDYRLSNKRKSLQHNLSHDDCLNMMQKACLSIQQYLSPGITDDEIMLTVINMIKTDKDCPQCYNEDNGSCQEMLYKAANRTIITDKKFNSKKHDQA